MLFLLFQIIAATQCRNDVHLGDTINQLRHRITKLLPNILQRNIGVFDNVMQHRGTDSLCIEI